MYVCLNHLIHDSGYWPGLDVFVGHFRWDAVDCTMIMGRAFLMNYFRAGLMDPTRRIQIYDAKVMMQFAGTKQTTFINDVRLFYGARGSKNHRYNDWKNGWVGVPQMTREEKIHFCDRGLTAHQVYPSYMYELWNHSKMKGPDNFSVPELSRNLNDLDKVTNSSQ